MQGSCRRRDAVSTLLSGHPAWGSPPCQSYDPETALWRGSLGHTGGHMHMHMHVPPQLPLRPTASTEYAQMVAPVLGPSR